MLKSKFSRYQQFPHWRVGAPKLSSLHVYMHAISILLCACSVHAIIHMQTHVWLISLHSIYQPIQSVAQIVFITHFLNTCTTLKKGRFLIWRWIFSLIRYVYINLPVTWEKLWWKEKQWRNSNWQNLSALTYK